MQQIVIRKGAFDHFSVVQFKDIPLDTLADFLVSDSLQAIDTQKCTNYEDSFFIQWLKDKDPKNDWTGGNTMEMIKRDNRIYLDSEFREDRTDYSNGFSTTTENMIQILRQWYHILSMHPLPDEVHLVQEGDIVAVLPKFVACEDEDSLFAIALKR